MPHLKIQELPTIAALLICTVPGIVVAHANVAIDLDLTAVLELASSPVARSSVHCLLVLLAWECVLSKLVTSAIVTVITIVIDFTRTRTN
jgi:hypothetical protein